MESLTGREDAVAERPTQDRAGSEHRPSTARALLAAMRPPEWIKNLLVYAGLLFSQQFDDPGRVLDATLAFVAFCAISSAGYLINDLRDVAFDRRHPEKRHRAIASGALSERLAWTAAVVLAAVAIGLSLAAVSAEVAGLVAAYGAITIAYSLILKRLVIPDVMTNAVPFLDQMVSMVTAAAIISYAIYAVNSPRIGSEMLATAPSVLYGIFRYLYLIYDRRDTRSTAAILTEDPGMIFAGVTWVGTALLMLYAFN